MSYDVHIPRCTHIKTNGTQCGSPALRGRRFCFFHKNWQGQRIQLNAQPAAPLSFTMPVLEDADSVQVALMQVMRLILAGQLDPKIAGLLLYALQTASLNLRHMKLEPFHHESVVIDPRSVADNNLDDNAWCKEEFEEEEEEDDAEEDEEEEDEEDEEESEDEELEEQDEDSEDEESEDGGSEEEDADEEGEEDSSEHDEEDAAKEAQPENKKAARPSTQPVNVARAPSPASSPSKPVQSARAACPERDEGPAANWRAVLPLTSSVIGTPAARALTTAASNDDPNRHE